MKMREILFRGKRINNGEWIDGYLYITHTGTYEIGCYNAETNIERWTFIVDPSTVGQYTGLKDKNGKRIFEGDILLWTGEDGETGKVIVIFAGGAFMLKCVEVAEADLDPFSQFEIANQTLEIIGCIHDSPELLKGGAE